jgi:hypothetical protein
MFQLNREPNNQPVNPEPKAADMMWGAILS